MLDLITSVKATLYDRIYSPLSGTFIISTLLTNYKITLLLFSSLSYHEKITIINGHLCNFLYVLIYLFLIPSVITAFYLIAYPTLEQKVYRIYLNNKSKLNKIKNEIEENKMLTLKESQEILKMVNEKEMTHNEEIERKNNEIKRLKEEIKQLGEVESSPSNNTNLERLAIKIHESLENQEKESIIKFLFNKRMASYPNKNPQKKSVTREETGQKFSFEQNANDLIRDGVIKCFYKKTSDGFYLDDDVMDILSSRFEKENDIENM